MVQKTRSQVSAARVLSAAKLSDYFRLILEREQITGRRITKIMFDLTSASAISDQRGAILEGWKGRRRSQRVIERQIDETSA
jgi:hypothetical protein